MVNICLCVSLCVCVLKRKSGRILREKCNAAERIRAVDCLRLSDVWICILLFCSIIPGIQNNQKWKSCRMRSYISDLYKIIQKDFDKTGDISWCAVLWHTDKVTPILCQCKLSIYTLHTQRNVSWLLKFYEMSVLLFFEKKTQPSLKCY